MRRILAAFPLILFAGGISANTSAPNCTGVPQILPSAPGMGLGVAQELYSYSSDLGAPTGVLAQAYDQSLSVEQVLLRIRIEACRVAMAAPAPTPANPDDPAVYRPQTAHDNTPWRFNMTQNGKRMTADEFDAWMRARGVRIATGRPAQTASQADASSAQGGQQTKGNQSH
ncbi:MAG: hypothetical protein Q4B94_10565 [Pseudomonadota bacterium]|nr:hypothetical protein [Pseudomonadota bacterium]